MKESGGNNSRGDDLEIVQQRHIFRCCHRQAEEQKNGSQHVQDNHGDDVLQILPADGRVIGMLAFLEQINHQHTDPGTEI